MFCRNCGKDLAGTPEVCINCGAKPMAGTSFCPKCGAPTTPSTEICTNCGVRVAGATKKKTWKPTAAGILCIAAGIIGAIPGIWVVLYSALIGTGWSIFIGALLIVVGMIPIVGGIYALRRTIWRLALAGSICALFAPVIFGTLFRYILVWALSEGLPPGTIPAILVTWWFGIPGILAIIFVIMGKGEFK